MKIQSRFGIITALTFWSSSLKQFKPLDNTSELHVRTLIHHFTWCSLNIAHFSIFPSFSFRSIQFVKLFSQYIHIYWIQPPTDPLLVCISMENVCYTGWYIISMWCADSVCCLKLHCASALMNLYLCIYCKRYGRCVRSCFEAERENLVTQYRRWRRLPKISFYLTTNAQQRIFFFPGLERQFI